MLLPAATLVSLRSPAVPPPKETVFGWVATELLPMATALVAPAATEAPAPIAVPPDAATEELAPNAEPWSAETWAL